MTDTNDLQEAAAGVTVSVPILNVRWQVGDMPLLDGESRVMLAIGNDAVPAGIPFTLTQSQADELAAHLVARQGVSADPG